MFDPKDGQHGFPDIGGSRPGGGGGEELPPDIFFGLGGGNEGPVLPADDPGTEFGQEAAEPDDLLDIGLHFYEKMNEL